MKKLENDTISWNNYMFKRHPTPYKGIAGFVEYKRVKRIVRIIKKSNFQKANVIALGCEQGYLLEYLSNTLPENNYFGTDVSDIAIKLARRRLGNKCTIIYHDMTSDEPLTNFPPIDIIICSEVLEHIPEYEKAIKNISTMITKTSLVIITIPLEKYKNWIKLVLKKMGLISILFNKIEPGMSEWHINDFSKKDILKILSKYFEVISYSLLYGIHQVIVLKKIPES